MEEQDRSMPDAPPTNTVSSDAPTNNDDQAQQKNDVVESIEVDTTAEQADNAAKEEDALADASDAEGEEDQDNAQDSSGRPVSNELYKALKTITDVLTDFKVKRGGDDHFPSLLFKRVPNKRNLPDYYQIIKEPSAISTLKGKIQRKSYTGIPEFVRDFALIVHNAQVYNRPNSQPVRDVLQLEAVFKAELHKLVEQGLVKEEETAFPDLGEIPAATPEPDPVSEDEEEDGDEDGDEDDDDGDDSDDGGRRKRKARPSGGRKRDDDDDNDEKRKRRGRPPKVDTPMEARIKSVIKSLRKPRDYQGQYRLRHFDRLPDKAEYPHYYQETKDPIAMDTIKKKAKRKKYTSVDHLMKDIELMFKNAMAYNVDGSEIYEDAKALLEEAHRFANEEKAKPDEDYLLDDGRVPLPDGIQYKGETWKIGDWIHIQNPNDVTKPIAAQIYRTWRDSDGQEWINVCWYYRPEQTIHQYEKHFYPNEIMKTGQYRDHHIQEVLDRCFVMFFTRYNRGRPRNIDPKTEVYVCEARYNEEKHKFNKIKTWASCLPDEVRDKDYEMDLFDVPRRIKKVPSTIKHLLKENVRVADLSPQWGSKNAPPIVGAVHDGARDDNQSPPPAPTPPPPPTPPPAPVRPPSSTMPSNHYQSQSRPGLLPHQTIQPQAVRPAPSATPSVPTYQAASASPAPQYGRPNLYHQASSGYQGQATPTPAAQASPYAAAQQLHPTPAYLPNNQAPAYHSAAPTQQPYPRQTIQQVQAQQAAQQQQQLQQQQYQPLPQQTYSQYPAAASHERQHEAYVLSDGANAAVPVEIRNQFPQDDEGRILFFTKPPLHTMHVVTGRTEGEKNQPLTHTKEYLEAKLKRNELIKERKRKIQASIDRNAVAGDYKRLKAGTFAEERDPDGRIKANPVNAAQVIIENEPQVLDQERQASEEVLEPQKKLVHQMRDNVVTGTANEYLVKYGSNAARYFEEDSTRWKERQLQWQQDRAMEEETNKPEMTKEEKIMADSQRMLSQNFWTGRYSDGKGRFEDDFDNRLPRPT